MGNAATKEDRTDVFGTNYPVPREVLLATDRLGGGIMSGSGLAGISKRKREKDQEHRRKREENMLNLIVRYDEDVDGGYLAPYSNYKYNLPYRAQVVRELVEQRRLAPFYTPLEDFDPSWTDEELLEYLHKMPLHARCTVADLADPEEDPDEHKIYQSANSLRRRDNKLFKKKLKERAVELQNAEDARYVADKESLRGSHGTQVPSDDLLLRLYRDAEECPICFLYYPKLMNMSRCCEQPICTECFVQMKRLDPHVPHDQEEADGASHTANTPSNPDDLISESVKCPFCAMPDFGVTYDPPEFKTGRGGIPPSEYRLTMPIPEESDAEAGETPSAIATSPPSRATSTSPTKPTQMATSLSSSYAGHNQTHSSVSHTRSLSGTLGTSPDGTVTRKRRGSLPPTAPGVVTVDMIQPDWEQRLLNARARLARRSAAATALHASSLIVEDRPAGSSGSGNGASTGTGIGSASHAKAQRPRRASARQWSRQEQADMEQKMIEEAMRLSILDEEERKLKEKEEKQKKKAQGQ